MKVKYKRGSHTDLSAHFDSSMFDCHCDDVRCVSTVIDDKLVAGLEALYNSEKGAGFFISSGYRCSYWNEKQGGKVGSRHLVGEAADCHPKTLSSRALAALAEKQKCFLNGGIGLYESFVHLDVRGHKSRWFGG